MATPNEREEKIVQDQIELGNIGPESRTWLESVLAFHREEIEARAPEQGGEMREALERLAAIEFNADGETIGREIAGLIIDDMRRDPLHLRALLARESAEAAEELICPKCGRKETPPYDVGDKCFEACGGRFEPAEERGLEVGDEQPFRECPHYNWGGKEGYPAYPREYGARCEKHNVFFNRIDGRLKPSCRECRAEVEARIGSKA